MKLFKMKNILAMMVVLFSLTAAGQSVGSDLETGLSYDPYQISQEWNAWHETSTPENAFIGDFMVEFNVPQTTVNPGLSLQRTWQWWASHNQAAVEEYIARRDAQE